MFQTPRKATTLFCMVLGQIDLGQILVTALVSAVVSFAVTVILRVWDRRTVEWLVAGEAHPTYFAGEKKDMVLNLELWNTGDADAYDVRLIRCNGVNPDTGKEWECWETFEAGCIKAGEHVAFTMKPSFASWETCWVKVVFRPSPVYRHDPRCSRKYLLSKEIGNQFEYRPEKSEMAVYGRGKIPARPKDA